MNCIKQTPKTKALTTVPMSKGPTTRSKFTAAAAAAAAAADAVSLEDMVEEYMRYRIA